MELTDIVTVKLGEMGAWLLNKNVLSYMGNKHIENIEPFKEGDIYEAPLWIILKVFSKDAEKHYYAGMNCYFTDLRLKE